MGRRSQAKAGDDRPDSGGEVALAEPATRPGSKGEDAQADALVARFHAGEPQVFTDLYGLYVDRVYAYLRLVLRDVHDAEDAAQHVFMRVFESLPRYTRGASPFRAWLFTIVKHAALQRLEKRDRLQLTDPAEIANHHEAATAAEAELRALAWVTDTDIVFLIEHLPLPQRQVLALRYMLGLSSAEAATVIGRSPEAVRMLQHRAIAFLRKRLKSLGREPVSGKSAKSRAYPRQARVVRLRKFSLTNPGPTG